MSLSLFAALIVGSTACNTAYADRLGPAQQPDRALAHAPAESPYEVELIGEKGQPLNVYEHRGRFYVLGSVGQRYTIRVQNPTNRRVEAVVSVDGLDVIDGKIADLNKRGYVVPAGGELRIDGFRVSTRQVATFRFSSVSNSYAGRKGKARNVGVIGVAIFEEKAPQEIILAQPVTPTPRPRKDSWRSSGHDRDYRGAEEAEFDGDDTSADRTADPTPSPAGDADRGIGRSAGSTASGTSGSVRTGAGNRPATKSATRSRGLGKKADSAGAPRREARKSKRHCCDKPKDRPGLGTEFGERRHSAVSWTRFERNHPTTPDALAEMRYNDAAGLHALGIDVAPVDPNELHIRETASPFPGGFAAPPR